MRGEQDMTEHKHEHNHNHHHAEGHDRITEPTADFKEEDFLKKHPTYLSQQSRRAFLASAGAAAALGANFAVGFLRSDRAEAKTETLMAADSIRNAGNIHVLKATPQNCFWGILTKRCHPS